MRNKLYYPYINIKDEEFLKYAILYYDKLNMIVPGTIRWKETMRMVSESTDLLEIIIPEHSYQICCEAADRTIKFIENRMRTDPEFDIYRNKHTSRLYQGKYNWVFVEYCKRNQLLSERSDGIRVHPVIASEYMTNLANIIAGNNDMDIVTDTIKYADYHLNPNYSEMEDSIKRDGVLRRELNFVLPVDMRRIPIDRIIEFRNNDEYVDMRNAFQRHVEKGMESVTQDDFDLHEYMRLKRDITKFFMSHGLEIMDFSMSVVLFATGCQTLGVTAFAAGAIGMAHDLKDVITDIKTGKLTNISDAISARRYLGKIKQLSYRT